MVLNNKLIKNILIVATLVVAVPAAAQTEIWDLDNGVKSSNTNFFDSLTVNNALNSNSLTITGWSDTGSGETIESGQLKYSNTYGLMLKNQNESDSTPDHSIDSFNSYFDMVLLSFDEKIDLTSFQTGWAIEANNLDRADISITAFTGMGEVSLAGNTWDGVASSNDWSTIGEYRDVSDYSYQSINTEVESKYWLVGAYNPIFVNPGETTGQWASANNDGFKLASVQGVTSINATSVPEPGSLAILSLGLLGFFSMKKRVVNRYK
jgi:hypothetical protein